MFNSPEQALKFAFRIREKSIISKSHNVYQVKERQKTYGKESITAHDLHAQGAMILSYDERLGDMESAWTYWSYGDGGEKAIAAKLLANRFEWTGVEIDRDKIFAVMMSSSARKCARDMGISKNRAWGYRRKVIAALSVVERRVLDGLWERLESGSSSDH